MCVCVRACVRVQLLLTRSSSVAQEYLDGSPRPSLRIRVRMMAAEIVDTEQRCRAVCAELLQDKALAVDIEGVNLCRHGEICIVQVAKRTGPVFLFDVVALGKTAFSSGLQEVLESDSVAKLLFDCRADADALHHLWQVTPRNVLDMQVLRDKANGGLDSFVHGLAKVLKDLLSPRKLEKAERVKAAGVALFAPEKGGSYDVWKKRPLPDVLQTYCAQDVQHLFAMKDKWGGCLSTARLRAVSEKRMLNQIRDKSFEKGPHRALKDFDFTDEWLSPMDSNDSEAAGSLAPVSKKQKTGGSSDHTSDLDDPADIVPDDYGGGELGGAESPLPWFS